MCIQIPHKTEHISSGDVSAPAASEMPNTQRSGIEPEARTVSDFETMLRQPTHEKQDTGKKNVDFTKSTASLSEDSVQCEESQKPFAQQGNTKLSFAHSEKKGGSLATGKESPTMQEDTHPEERGDAPLGILGGMTHPLTSLFPQTPAAAEVAPPATTLAVELVERILVNAPEQGQGEVRLFLHQNVLLGTEIRIQRTVDGLLDVHIHTDNASSLQTIVSARDTLQKGLERLENTSIRLEITHADQQESQQDNQNRRSKGYQKFVPDDNSNATELH